MRTNPFNPQMLRNLGRGLGRLSKGFGNLLFGSKTIELAKSIQKRFAAGRAQSGQAAPPVGQVALQDGTAYLRETLK